MPLRCACSTRVLRGISSYDNVSFRCQAPLEGCCGLQAVEQSAAHEVEVLGPAAEAGGAALGQVVLHPLVDGFGARPTGNEIIPIPVVSDGTERLPRKRPPRAPLVSLTVPSLRDDPTGDPDRVGGAEDAVRRVLTERGGSANLVTGSVGAADVHLVGGRGRRGDRHD